MSRDIRLELIDRDPEQPRRHFDEAKIAELAQSMEAKGLAVSILLRPTGDRFTIVHGERRWRAAKQLRWETIRAEVRDIDAAEARWLSLIENVQRQDLSPIEEARAFEARLGEGLTQAELGERIGKSQSYIAHKLRLLRMPEPLRFFVDWEAITEGHARQLMKLKAIYPDGLTSRLDWTGPFDQEREPLALLCAIRPEENPVWLPNPDAVPTAINEGCAVFYEYSVKGEIPTWAVTAFWWACATIGTELSVANLSKAIELWRERFLSAVAYINLHPEAPRDPSSDWEWLESMRWWGYWADVRHAGLSEWLEVDPGTLPQQEAEARSEFMWDMSLWAIKHGHHSEPSNLQSWGSAYQQHKERVDKARAAREGYVT